MSRPLRIKSPRTLSILISEEWRKHIERKATELSLQQDRRVTIAEIVRLALEVAFPLPNSQMKFKL